jgi:hypothetical protein
MFAPAFMGMVPMGSEGAPGGAVGGPGDTSARVPVLPKRRNLYAALAVAVAVAVWAAPRAADARADAKDVGAGPAERIQDLDLTDAQEAGNKLRGTIREELEKIVAVLKS